MTRCEACDGPLTPGLTDWHFECRTCRTETSSLAPTIGDGGAQLDEVGRAEGLRDLRQRGYARILERLQDLRSGERGALLEVGSAHGWFLQVAAPLFDHTVGIEPDDGVRTDPVGAAADVRAGCFPEALRTDEGFDVVVFNDVFEHIRPTEAVATAVAQSLHPEGIAVINLPVATGTIYRASKLLCRVGLRRPFERMWQVGFPSPHLYYFSEEGLRRIFGRHGLRLATAFPMPTLHTRGLWQRIRHAEPTLVVALASYVSSLCILPFLRALPADVKCFLFEHDP